jgi:hypothetical protein
MASGVKCPGVQAGVISLVAFPRSTLLRALSSATVSVG